MHIISEGSQYEKTIYYTIPYMTFGKLMEMVKLQRQEKDQWLGEETKGEQGEHEGFWGQWNVLYDTMMISITVPIILWISQKIQYQRLKKL